MQKKLYFLDEQEKNRIIELHESRTQKQYLLNEASTRENFNKKINDICNAGTYGTGNLSTAEVQKISDTLSNTYLRLNSGYMNNNSLNRMTQLISGTKLISNFCLVLKKFNETTQRSLMYEFDRFIYNTTAWDLAVRMPLDNLIKNSDEFKQKSDTDYQKISQGITSGWDKLGWDKFPCVLNNPKKRETKTPSGVSVIIIDEFQYYANGRRMNLSTKKMSDYHCGTDGLIKDGVKSASGSGVVTTGGGGLSTRVSAIQKQLGLAQSGKMDQATINTLMGKIQGGSTTTNNPTTPQSNVVG